MAYLGCIGVERAHGLDREVADRRFIVRSGDEDEAVEPAKIHVRDVHGRDYPDEELRSEHLKTV